MPKDKTIDPSTPLAGWYPVAVRFTLSEQEQIRQAAERRGLSINSFIRKTSHLSAVKVLQAASADEELRRIVID